ncbi:MAG: thiolase, partial [Chloroflexi bacterium]|nr:thiolase [Chloroflexota bacterium]
MGALTDKYCIVGVGETPHMRPSGRTTLSMACEAVKNAMADAGLRPQDIDGMTSYQYADSCSSGDVSSSLGIRLSYAVDIIGGGNSTETLVAHAIGLIEAGYCENMLIFRSMNGRSFNRQGGQAPDGAAPVPTISSIDDMWAAWGFTTPAQHHSMTCMRYMRD